MENNEMEVTQEVEAMAQRIYDELHRGMSNCYAWDDLWEDHQEAKRYQYYRMAHAVQAVMEAVNREDYQTGLIGGRMEALAEIDRLTGGSGMYSASGAGDDCPNWQAMRDKIARRFDAINRIDREEREARTTALAAKEAENAELRAKVEKLREALTPSGDTKAAYHGEFSFQLFRGVSDAGIDQYEKVYVPWTTTKEIMGAIMARATLAEMQP